MNEQVLSIEQMNHLRELGLDTSDANMCWIRSAKGDRTLEIHDEYCYEMNFLNPVPSFTLQDILYVLEKAKYKSMGFPILFFDYNFSFNYWELAFRNPNGFNNPIIKEKTPLEAAYKMLVWCLENKLINV